jgi:threonine dehydrogenase-like Zn-dependent dehydrogenase
MKTKAVRLHGVNDLRLDEFDLPPIGEDEILARVVSDSICMSTHKLAVQGERHKRVRGSLADTPVMVGHECCGVILEVGAKWAGRYKPGDKFALQPALNYKGTLWSPGYSYEYIGGDATHIVIPNEVMELGCLLPYRADNFFMGSLAEPVSCVIGAFHAQYHTRPCEYSHDMGIKLGGSVALLASAGPMGLGAIDYAIHGDRKPGRVVVTDIDQARLDRAASLLPPETALKLGIELSYVNTATLADPAAALKTANGGQGFDDVFVFAPVKPVVELADSILGRDGCLNFFAGPVDSAFSASINFYDVHYSAHHLVGTSGGSDADMLEALDLMTAGTLNSVGMITHIGGLDAVPRATIDLDRIPGGKKLIYTGKRLDLVAIADFAERGKTDSFYRDLDAIVKSHNLLWCEEAEDYLLAHAPDI